MGHKPLRNRHALACAGIASLTRISLRHTEAAKATNFNPAALFKRVTHGLQQDTNDGICIFLGKTRKTPGQLFNEFGADHGGVFLVLVTLE